MSITTEEKKKYFAETALALSRAGFHVEEIPDNKLGVWLDEQPLCEVGEIGGITYRSDNISTPERMAAKDKAYQIVRNTAEYMRQMEQAPPLKVTFDKSSIKQPQSSGVWRCNNHTPHFQSAI